MTPLSEALTAAQRASLKTLEAAYVAGHIEADDMTMHLLDCGITDRVDLVFLIAALDVLREWGVAAPTMTERVTEATKDDPSSQKQRDHIRSLADEKGIELGVSLEELVLMTKAQASEAITELQNGSYDPAKY